MPSPFQLLLQLTHTHMHLIIIYLRTQHPHRHTKTTLSLTHSLSPSSLTPSLSLSLSHFFLLSFQSVRPPPLTPICFREEPVWLDALPDAVVKMHSTNVNSSKVVRGWVVPKAKYMCVCVCERVCYVHEGLHITFMNSRVEVQRRICKNRPYKSRLIVFYGT